jgi:hypothetical protein
MFRQQRSEACGISFKILDISDNAQNDLIVTTTSDALLKGGEAVLQEEKGHRAISRSGAGKALTVELEDTPSIARSLEKIEPKYSDLSLVVKRNEVVAKSFRSDAARELGIIEEQVIENRRAFIKSLENNGVDPETVAAELEQVSPVGKEFAKNVRERINSGRQRSNGETVADRKGTGDSIAEGLQDTRQTGNGKSESDADRRSDQLSRIQPRGSSAPTRTADAARDSSVNAVLDSNNKPGNQRLTHAEQFTLDRNFKNAPDLEKVAAEFEQVSPEGKEFAKNVRKQINSGRQRSNGENVGAGKKRSDSSDESLREIRGEGRGFGNRLADGKSKSDRNQSVSPNRTADAARDSTVDTVLDSYNKLINRQINL